MLLRLITDLNSILLKVQSHLILFFIFFAFSLSEGYVGEFLVLVGTFQKNIIVAVLASLGIILAAAYMLWLYRRVIFGRLVSAELKEMKDLNKTELYIFISLAFLTIFFDFYPEPLLDTIDISINKLIENYQTNLNLYLAQGGK